jgi:hypothetical protein
MNSTLAEIYSEHKPAQEVQAQQAIDGSACRQCVSQDKKSLPLLPQRFQSADLQSRDILDAAAGVIWIRAGASAGS